MIARVVADVLVVLHLAFILFVVLGGFLVLKWPRAAWVHLPCATWGMLIEFGGWLCPLTPLENSLRRAAGSNGYAGGFIDHYIAPLVYPPGLDRTLQLGLAAAVVVINLLVYGAVLARRRGRSDQRTAREQRPPRWYSRLR
jgi:hypothetical protein